MAGETPTPQEIIGCFFICQSPTGVPLFILGKSLCSPGDILAYGYLDLLKHQNALL